MKSQARFDFAFVGHYTKDTIVYPDRTHTQDGGAYFFGASVAVRMGLRVAVVTRLAPQDMASYRPLEELGVTVYATPTPQSTCLRLVYPTADLDQRIIYATGSAGPFTVQEVQHLRSRAVHVGASVRGEVPAEVVRHLKEHAGILSLDVQGYLRTNCNGVLVADDWPGKEEILQHVDVLKADAAEAERLTGTRDLRQAARTMTAWGPAEVLITHSDGLLVLACGDFYHRPFAVDKVRGRSGRGDTCTAAYVAKRLSAPPAQAATWAAAVTSLKLRKEGPFTDSLEAVRALIRARYSAP